MKFSIIIAIIFIFLASCANGDKEVQEKPNIIFIMLDDLGYGQLGIYNDTIKTSDFDPFFVQLVNSFQGYSLDTALEFSKKASPTITNLARTGITFNKAYTTSSLCAPSRLGIATGTLQNRYGIYTNVDCENHGIKEGSHLAEGLHNLGYKTAHIGKWHIGIRDSQIIYDVFKEKGINEELSYAQVRKLSPEIFEEVEEKGYNGSVIRNQNPLNNGFDYYYGYNNWASQYYNSTNVWEGFKHAGKQKGYNTDVFTDKALDFMEQQINADTPFYVELFYHAVHDSIEPKAPPLYFDQFGSDSYHLNNFFAHIYGVDYNLNRIVEFLKSKKQYDNTIFVFTSDNGAMCGGSYNGDKTGSPLPGNTPFSGTKGNFFQGGMRVPMFFHWPAGIKNSGISKQLVSTMDILPTLLDAAGGKVPDRIDGKSLMPIINNQENISVHDYLLWAGIHSYAWGYLIEKTTKTHHSERKFAPPAWALIKGNYLLRYTGILEPGIYNDHLNGREPVMELFDIKNDPAEKINLAQQMPEKLMEMSEIYFKESDKFPPPVVWQRQKWEQIVSKNNKFLKK